MEAFPAQAEAAGALAGLKRRALRMKSGLVLAGVSADRVDSLRRFGSPRSFLT